jgi:hypothetical protein
MKKFLFIFLFFAGWTYSFSQIDLKVRVSQRNITTDDFVRVSFIAQGDTPDLINGEMEYPSFENFIVRGPYVSQESIYVNGTYFSKKSYTFSLKPVKTGKLTIGTAIYKLNGKEYKTKPITINVKKGNAPVTPPANTSRPNQEKSPEKVKTDDIFLVAQLTKKNPYINEAVGLTYKLYIPSSYGVKNYQELSQPQYNGFWAQDIDRNISGPFPGEINGKKYEYFILKKKLLFPQQTGKLNINPLTLSIDIQIPVVRQMGYFKIRDYEIKRIKLSSGSKNIRVRPLPEKNKPIDFSGAVGNFDFFVQADKNNVQSGEAVNISVGVKGVGNLKLFNLPELKAPEGVEIYDPTHTENIRPTFEGNKGEIVDKYILIPNRNGKFIIPSMRFSYFNPETESYEIKTSDDIILFSTGNKAYSSSLNEQNNNPAGGTSLRSIKEKQNPINKKTYVFYRSKTFYWLTGLPFLLAFLFFIYKKYRDNRVIDESKIKYKQRKTLAQRYLKEAATATSDKDLFYDKLEKAIHHFLKAKLKIDTSDLSKENIKKLLSDKNLQPQDIDEMISLLNNCEMARYTPFGQGDIQNDLKRTEKILTIIDKQI